MSKLKRKASQKAQTEDRTALGGLVMARVITRLDLDQEDLDFVNEELKWLFSAADHLLKICGDEIDRNQPIPVPIPSEAEKQPEADNRLLDKPKNYAFEDIKNRLGRIETRWQKSVERQVESMFKIIDSHLKGLKHSLNMETELGQAGKSDIPLQHNIKGKQVGTIKTLQDMAKFMNDAYGVLVTSPDQLAEFLEQQ